MYSTAVQSPRRRAYSFWYAVSSRCMCSGTLYLPRGFGQPRQRRVRAPVQIGRRQLDLHPALVLVPSVHVLEQRDVVVERELEPVVPALHRSAQFRRQAGDERRIVLIHQPVLVAHRERIRHPHADILVGADHFIGAPVHLGQLARHPAMDVLHRGDARGDHLERRIQRVEIHVQIARHHAGDEPQFQRHVRRAELHRREADMVMAVDETRQQDFVAGADHRDGRVAALQVREGADGGDGAILLQDCAVGDLVPAMAIERAGDHRAAADQ